MHHTPYTMARKHNPLSNPNIDMQRCSDGAPHAAALCYKRPRSCPLAVTSKSKTNRHSNATKSGASVRWKVELDKVLGGGTGLTPVSSHCWS